jgi:hypothetical protein
MSNHAEHRQRRPEPMPHVFLSYVREDQELVDQLATHLKQNGVEVWLDREKIRPGERWQAAISSAIEQGAFFIACFSTASSRRNRSFMNEELTRAVDELRKRSPDRAWFIPVLLDECQVPVRSIGGGESLADLHWLKLYENWTDGLRRLLEVVAPREASFDQIVAELELPQWKQEDWDDFVNTVRPFPVKRGQSRDGMRCVPIIGSRVCGPVAEAVRAALLRHVDKTSSAIDAYADVGVLAEHAASLGRLKRDVARSVAQLSIEDCAAHQLLAAMPFALYLTTGFDDLLFDALTDQKRFPVREVHSLRERLDTPNRSRLDGRFDLMVIKPVVYHLFGHHDDFDSLVISDEEYRNFSVTWTQIPATVRCLLEDEPIVFLGFHSQDRQRREVFAALPKLRRGSMWVAQFSPVEELRYVGSRVAPGELSNAAAKHFEHLSRYFRLRGIQVFWGTPEAFLTRLNAEVRGRFGG